MGLLLYYVLSIYHHDKMWTQIGRILISIDVICHCFFSSIVKNTLPQLDRGGGLCVIYIEIGVVNNKLPALLMAANLMSLKAEVLSYFK